MNESEERRDDEENLEAVEKDDEKLKGDAIGDTLFSESWVLKTLIKLTEVYTVFYCTRV